MKNSLSIGVFAAVSTGLSVWALAPQWNAAPAFEFPVELIDISFMPRSIGVVSPNFTAGFDSDSGGRAITARFGERDPLGEWFVQDLVEAVSFWTTAIAPTQGGHTLYVAGIQEDGVDVLERWSYAAREGGYGIEVTSGAPEPLGTSMPDFAGQEYLNGASFTPPAEPRDPASRHVIYRGTDMGHIRSIVADPEGRFLFALSYPTGALYRFDLIQPGLPELLYTAEELPHLSSATSLVVSHHVTDGRQYVICEFDGCMMPPEYSWTLLGDPNNDGVLDSPITLTADEWTAAGYGEYESSRDYGNFGVVFDW